MSLYPWDVPYWTTIWGENSCEVAMKFDQKDCQNPLKNTNKKGKTFRWFKSWPNFIPKRWRSRTSPLSSGHVFTHSPSPKRSQTTQNHRRLLWTQSCVPLFVASKVNAPKNMMATGRRSSFPQQKMGLKVSTRETRWLLLCFLMWVDQNGTKPNLSMGLLHQRTLGGPIFPNWW